MKRNGHEFQFNGKQIADAATVERDYHRERLAWWQAEQEKATALAKEKGVETREYDVTGGKRVDIILDPNVQTRLTECSNKIYAHRMAADRFQIEAAAYGTQTERVYQLDPDDVIYFRLAGGARAD